MSVTTEQPKRRALGKGLESLLPRVQAKAEETPAVPAQTQAPVFELGKPREIPVELIDKNPYQTRTNFNEPLLFELMQSIAATGVVQPVILRPTPEGRFQLIAGERRWIATKRLGKATIPSILRAASDEQVMEMTIVENLQRADLNPIEQARAFDRLGRDFQMTQEQIAKRTGKDRASVGNFLRLLKLPAEIQGKIESGELSFGHARALLALEDPEQISMASQKVLALSMSVRQTETFVQNLLNPEKKQKAEVAEEEMDPNVRDAQVQLQRKLGLKVRIEDKNGRGRVIIEYARLEDFDSLIEVLNR